MRRAQLFILTCAVLTASVAPADGYRMENGRYASGPTTVLELTSEQLITVKTSRIVVLDALQRAALAAAAGAAPTVLKVDSLAIAGTDCTCDVFNLAIWIEPGAIEVPHAYLVSDEEAEKRFAESDAFLASEAEERRNAATDAFLASRVKNQ